MSRFARGFTMTELLVVVAIVSILALVAFPAWNNYSIRSANNACLTEVSGYKVAAVAALHDGVALPVTTSARCTAINTAAIGTLGVPGVITATAAAPGDATISCSIAAGGACGYTSPSGN